MGADSFLLVRPSEQVAGRPAAADRRAAHRHALPELNPLAIVLVVLAAGLFGFDGFVRSQPSKAGVLVAPALFVLVSAAVRRCARNRADGPLVTIAEVGYALKLVLTVFRFRAGVDSVTYNQVGAQLAQSFRRFDFAVDTGRSIPGTGSVRYFTGIVHLATGSNYVATFLIYGLIGFWGQYLIARGIAIALPSTRVRRVYLLVFCWPSLAYWPASIGKESLVLFGIGLTTYGVARYVVHLPHALVCYASGLAVVTMIRPHVALLLVTATTVPFIARASRGNQGAALFGKLVALVALVVLGTLVAHQTEQRLNLDDLSGSSISLQLDRTVDQTSQGGGQFDAARVRTPLDFPWAGVTVLFRPFPYEARGVPQLISSFEGILLLGLLCYELPLIARWLRRPRQVPLVLFALAYAVAFVYLFSAIANFGILVRQRTQVLPFVLLLAALPPLTRPRPDRAVYPFPIPG